MGEAKPLASLSGSLLARKGGAKPAMRRPQFGNASPHQPVSDDLGWNDMGYDVDPDQSAEMPRSMHDFLTNPLEGAIAEPLPVVKQQQEEIADRLNRTYQISRDYIEDMEMQKALAGREDASVVEEKAELILDTPVESNVVEPDVAEPDVAEHEALEPVLVVPDVAFVQQAEPRGKTKTKGRRKAAFTLRLDADRHLRLRLATAVKGISAQNLVTKALDEYLSKMPEIDDMAGRLPADTRD